MKTILKIVSILLVASVVAGAFSLAVNHGTTTSNANVNSQSFRPLAGRDGGDREGGSSVGVFGTLAKITGITILVLVLQNAFDQLKNRKLISTQR